MVIGGPAQGDRKEKRLLALREGSEGRDKSFVSLRVGGMAVHRRA